MCSRPRALPEFRPPSKLRSSFLFAILVNIDIVASKDGAEVKCTAQTIAQTGVEMEALVGVTVALLTIYDMCKAVDKDMIISDVQLFEKTKSAVATVHDRHSKKTRRS